MNSIRYSFRLAFRNNAGCFERRNFNSFQEMVEFCKGISENNIEYAQTIRISEDIIAITNLLTDYIHGNFPSNSVMEEMADAYSSEPGNEGAGDVLPSPNGSEPKQE